METREIKFRAWDKTIERIVYPDDFLILTGNEGLILSPHHVENLYSKSSDPDRFKIMQYTGLKDKNGVEIYEGDVVTDGSRKYIVGFDTRQAKFNLQFVYSDYEIQQMRENISIGQTHKDIPVDSLFHHVIGNIFEENKTQKH